MTASDPENPRAKKALAAALKVPEVQALIAAIRQLNDYGTIIGRKQDRDALAAALRAIEDIL